MFAHSPSTKTHMSPQIIQFSDVDEKSIRGSPYSKTFNNRDLTIPSFGMISQNPSIDLPSSSSSQSSEILLVHCANNTLVISDDPYIDKLLSTNRMRFVVQISVSRATTQCITLREKPIFSDSNQCKYYLLKCYLCSEQTPMSFYLLRFGYSIALYFCLPQINEKMMSFLNVALKNMKPPVWKTNTLLLGNSEQEEISTAYETTTNQPSTFKSSGLKHQTSTHASGSMEKCKKSRLTDLKHQVLNYFTNISTLTFESKLITMINLEKSKGLLYQLQDLVALVQKINTNTLLLDDFQGEMLKSNMQQKVTQCKKQYITLCNTVYNSGKSIQFIRLRVLLTQMYSSVLDSFDRDFQAFQGLEDYDIHRSILRRWVETQEQQVFEVNSILHETQTTKMIQTSMGKGSELQSNIEAFFQKNKDQRLKGANLDALVLFLKSTYMEAVKKKVESIQQTNKRRIIREINYYQNPAQMLKNCEQRLNLSNDKKEYLLKCIQLVERQIQNLDNLYHGLSLEQQRESMKFKALAETKGGETMQEGFRTTFGAR